MIINKLHSLLWWVICIATSSILLVVFVNISGVNAYEKARLADMLEGKAYRPFVYRVLVPGIANGVTSVLPDSFEKSLENHLNNSPAYSRSLSRFRASPELAVESLIILLILGGSIVGFSASFRALLLSLYSAPSLVVDITCLFAMMGLLPFIFIGYIYDFSVLFLFTLALVLLHKQHWWAYLVVFTLAVLTKETAIFLVIPFILYFWFPKQRIQPSLAVKLLAAQGLIYLFLQLAIRSHYSGNPGVPLEFHLYDHLWFWINRPALSIISTITSIIVIYLIFIHPLRKPPFLVSACMMLIPLLIMFIFFGYPIEIRVFYEVYSVATLIIIQQLLDKTRFRLVPLPESPPQ